MTKNFHDASSTEFFWMVNTLESNYRRSFKFIDPIGMNMKGKRPQPGVKTNPLATQNDFMKTDVKAEILKIRWKYLETP